MGRGDRDKWKYPRLRSALFGRLHQLLPWSVDVPAAGTAVVYFIEHGPFWLRMPGCDPRHIPVGNIACLPAGAGHQVASDDAFRNPITITSPEGLAHTSEHEPDRSNPSTIILTATGFWEADARIGILGLPELVVLPASSAINGFAGLQDCFRALIADGTPHSTAIGTLVVNAMLLAIFEHALGPAGTTALPLEDPAIVKALLEIQNTKSRLRVDELAAITGLSRSTFIERFKAATGQPPAQFQADLMLTRAADHLLISRERVGDIALAFGFGSEIAFCRAFTRRYGESPARWRNRQRTS